jgi:hypothetical protein
MKTTFLKTATAIFILVFASCSNDDAVTVPTPIPTPIATGSTSFKLNGVLITADEVTATHYTNSVAGGKYIDVFVKKAGKEVLELHFPANTGTYPAQQSFDMTSSWLTYKSNDGATYPDDYYNSTSGEMKVTTLDMTGKVVKGTFSFVGNNGSSNATITEGVLFVNQITVQ